MKYLCLIYNEEKKFDAMPKGELNAVVGECLAYDETLRKSGHLLPRRPSNPFIPRRAYRSGTARYRSSMDRSPRPRNSWAALVERAPVVAAVRPVHAP